MKRILFSVCMILIACTLASAQTINVYSYRQTHLMEPLLEEFKKQTGIDYRLLTGAAGGLLERLIREGANSPADVLITVDAGNLVAAKQAGVLQPIQSEVLEKNIPAHYRDVDGQWYGLSARSRVLYYAPDRIDPALIATYESLADPALGKRICVRSSSNVYNQSLMASMIAHHGSQKAEEWARGLVSNFARQPQDNDTAQIRAVAAGQCDVGIANTYYFGRVLDSNAAQDKDIASKVKLLWPNQADRGAHMNLSGAGVTKSSKNVAAAIKLIEFLASEKAQVIYAEHNHEYPVNPAVPVAGTIASFGEFTADTLNLSELEKYQAEAVRIMDRVGWR